jgi:hypothetical protein
MTTLKKCKFYRNSGTNNIDVVIGYCDLDCDQTTCDGDIDFCEKSNTLKIYLFEQIKREGGLEWEIKKNVPFVGIQKL